MLTDVFLIGAGGHGKVVYEAWSDQFNGNIQLWDDDQSRQGSTMLAATVNAPITMEALPAKGHVAIGDNLKRQQVITSLIAAGKQMASVIHKYAILSKYCDFEDGCFVAAHAIISPDVQIHTGVIINHGAVVDHDCNIGAFAHVAPNATLGGGVTIGDGCLIGAGAVVLPGVSIADNVIVGAGAVVTSNIAEKKVVVCGIPAKSQTGSER